MSSMYSTVYVDELLREYLVFRGFTKTLQQFNLECKNDRMKGFQASAIIEELFEKINTFQLNGLLELWSYLDSAFFSKLDNSYRHTVKKLENSLKKYYLVNASQNSSKDKILHFFEICSGQINTDPEWVKWFGEFSLSKFLFSLTKKSSSIFEATGSGPQLQALLHQKMG